ncbi:Stress up-regulated Nod [Trema orientale]|uniref:Stress up-regulated Nod n=1 Tax=Trema orientale TaxID=63057 RepID=A0A2P5FI61_TREOI|nr:Stress up-regulated Nod [Trema orientale]
MVHHFGGKSLCLAMLTLVFTLNIPCSNSLRIENRVKTKSAVFRSPVFELEPGSVLNRIYYNIDFPRGHIAVKSFKAEVVDEAGRPVPLHETYLHHWVILRYYQRKGVSNVEQDSFKKLDQTNFMFARNNGVCQKNVLGQYFGLGSETRKTPTFVPDPYGIEVGNPAEIPDGFEERWLMNVHAIDTRGAEDSLGCTECRCDLYNISKDEYGRPLGPDYKGGLLCCYDQTQCRVRKGFQGTKRSLYLRYSVEWVDWTDSILPVKIYIFDITDTWNGLNSAKHDCKIEYNVAESCKGTGTMSSQGCVDTRRKRVRMPTGGYVVYGVAHQHTGGTGSTLYGEDGRVICSSNPIYGKGKEVGNESGYIVGMSTCYPQHGSVKILDGETLIHESNYNSSQTHTGVMGLFYILVANQLPNPKLFMHSPL